MKKYLKLLFVSILSFSIVGCGPKSGVTTSDPEQQEEWTMGNPSETAFVLQVNNETGSDITSIQIKADNQEEYSANLIPDGIIFHQGESVDFYYEPAQEENDETTYQLKVSLAGKGEFLLTIFTLRDMKKSVTIHSTKGVVFIKYISLATGSQVSTLDTELEEKKKRDEEEAQRRKEEEEQEARKKEEEEAQKKLEQEMRQSQQQAEARDESGVYIVEEPESITEESESTETIETPAVDSGSDITSEVVPSVPSAPSTDVSSTES